MFVFLVLLGFVAADYNCDTKALSEDQRKLLLEGHNEIRRKIAFGELENKEGLPPLGPAKNMYALDWDCDLEKKAEESLAQCTLNEKVDAGRNMILLNGGTLGDTDYMTIALDTWVAPVKFFGKQVPTNKYDGMHCQFANMVHANTTKVGCSFKRCGDDFLFACLYDKCGVKAELLWEEGQPCEDDDHCTTFYGSECEKGLCIMSH
ncbi:SCP-like protein [Ancylostoma caninum]|uniref:SCP-like protein n=1 Tax=Ancylostoma caninum TaxID=29170 RepID=A0A368H270_ANCCA|nr:SCP-like protein [Ancylostoma caninum]